MTTLREAAQQALEALEAFMHDSPRPYDAMRGQAAMGALRAALAEPVQEPVAWLYEAGANRTLHWNKPPLYGTPLYLSPPQRQPLAEWQINDLMAGIDPEDVCSWSFRQGVYAAEKHHGVKP